jgi:hypothetical protein
MSPSAETMPTTPAWPAEETPKGCMLGRPLGDCSLRRAGCESLYHVLPYLYPPQTLLNALRSKTDLPPDIATWLRKLETVTPQPQRIKPSDRIRSYFP